MEDQDDDVALLKVAEAVSDGKPVDWDAAQSRHDEAEADLAHLQALESVAAAFRAARQPPENSDNPSAGALRGSEWRSADPHSEEPRRLLPESTLSGKRRSGPLRAGVLLALGLAALYLAVRWLWKL